MMINVLLVEDHLVVAEGIASMLKGLPGFGQIHHAASCADALAALGEARADLILLDVNLPDGNGIDLCAAIRRMDSSVHIICLSTFNHAGIIQKMLDSGAEGYLMKNCTSEELVAAIETVFGGKRYIAKEVKEILDVNKPLLRSGTPVFTKREKEVLVLIAEGLTTPEIAEKLFISQLTVISHRKSLLDKTTSKNTAQLVQFCFTNGLL